MTGVRHGNQFLLNVRAFTPQSWVHGFQRSRLTLTDKPAERLIDILRGNIDGSDALPRSFGTALGRIAFDITAPVWQHRVLMNQTEQQTSFIRAASTKQWGASGKPLSIR
jgi:hypothetical protein